MKAEWKQNESRVRVQSVRENGQVGHEVMSFIRVF